MKLVDELKDYAFLLENDPDFASADSARKILHGLSPEFAETNSTLPKGMTLADKWMAKHGNPLKDIEGAIQLVRLIDSWAVVHAMAEFKPNTFAARIWIDSVSSEGVSFNMPSAIVAAALNHPSHDREEN